MEVLKMSISVENFGKDHWSLLAYIENCNVDHKGFLDKRRLRCNPSTHLIHAHLQSWDIAYGTILKDRTILPQHDDWDCIDDLEVNGFIELISNANHIVFLTDKGKVASASLRLFKMNGGRFADFVFEDLVLK
jgi:hypothetical protein